jgi:hypothetical protein
MIVALIPGPLVVGALLLGAAPQDGGPSASPRPSIQESLVQPFHLPFREPTSLEHVAELLRRELSGPVVLDRAALTRLELQPGDTVQLELDGVRLKTGLQLLLDQVGMTFRVVPEDNLLILTDSFGADDPYERILDEIETLHRELHDLRDAVDDLQESIATGAAEGAMRKPTILEEIPGEPVELPKERAPQASPERSEPHAVRPGAARPLPHQAPRRTRRAA